MPNKGKRTGDANKTVPDTFREYPPLVQRLQALDQEIAQILPRRNGAITSTKEFQEFKDSLQTIKHEIATPQNSSKDH